MIVSLLITNDGPHPPEKWAGVTSSQIIDIAASAPNALYKEAREFEAKIQDVLTHHHQNIQDRERRLLKEQGSPRLAEPMGHDQDVEDCVGDICDMAKKTSFADHFAKPDVQQYLTRLLREHFHHNALIERQYHADRIQGTAPLNDVKDEHVVALRLYQQGELHPAHPVALVSNPHYQVPTPA